MTPPSDDQPPQRRVPGLAPLLTSKQAAELLAVSERTVWSMYTSGEIPCIRIRSTVRFSAADLAAWIDKHRTTR